ncbi:hypothetical protein [Pseudoprevotella muciniphila]|uniref:hypothetical protein n=1 Tax=Pseudoprevotella muciniphila TaxID=2133944 RepID=UPI001867309D|nr:hypothetical protein [Pseudoprevotella muciniphila]
MTLIISSLRLMILAVASEQNSSDANAYGAVLWKMESQFFTARPFASSPSEAMA